MGQNQYFEDNRSLPSNRKEHTFRFLGHCYTFTTDNGVFSRDRVDQGTEILLKAAAGESFSGTLLDLGCGYGIVGIVLKTMNPDCPVTCSDVNPRAVELARLNAGTAGCGIEVVQSDGFDGLAPVYDAIVTNPPIRTGKTVLYRLLKDAREHLRSGGLFLCVIRRQQGAESAVRYLQALYGNCCVTLKDKGYWVLRCIR